MSKDYLVHWVIGLLCAVIWFWGDKAGIPKEAVSLASTVVPALLGHAVAFTPDASPLVQAAAPDAAIPVTGADTAPSKS